jgi:hypothetical protein
VGSISIVGRQATGNSGSNAFPKRSKQAFPDEDTLPHHITPKPEGSNWVGNNSNNWNRCSIRNGYSSFFRQDKTNWGVFGQFWSSSSVASLGESSVPTKNTCDAKPNHLTKRFPSELWPVQLMVLDILWSISMFILPGQFPGILGGILRELARGCWVIRTRLYSAGIAKRIQKEYACLAKRHVACIIFWRAVVSIYTYFLTKDWQFHQFI